MSKADVLPNPTGPSRDLDGARKAFEIGDVEASRAAHDARLTSAPEVHGGVGSEFIKSIVFGGLDGIITTFAVIATVAGANLELDLVILMGFANLIGDGISMGFGDYLSSKAEMEFARHELKREEWEFREHPDGERREMVELFVSKGMDEGDATEIIRLYSKYPKLYVDLMMYEELNIMPPDSDADPAKEGLVTFFSFLLFGSIPLWGYVVFRAMDYNDKQGTFVIACIIAGVTMFLLGAVKAKVTRQNPLTSGGLMLLNGGIAATCAYLAGFLLEEVLNLPKGTV